MHREDRKPSSLGRKRPRSPSPSLESSSIDSEKSHVESTCELVGVKALEIHATMKRNEVQVDSGYAEHFTKRRKIHNATATAAEELSADPTSKDAPFVPSTPPRNPSPLEILEYPHTPSPSSKFDSLSIPNSCSDIDTLLFLRALHHRSISPPPHQLFALDMDSSLSEDTLEEPTLPWPEELNDLTSFELASASTQQLFEYYLGGRGIRDEVDSFVAFVELWFNYSNIVAFLGLNNAFLFHDNHSKYHCPLVAVVGATGAQGGSVIRALIDSTEPYRIRGFTRDVAKPASQNLVKQGVEMIAVNLVLNNAENVSKAFVGANMAFESRRNFYDYIRLVTNFWEHLDAKKQEGKMMIDAVKAAGVERVVWSGLQVGLQQKSAKANTPTPSTSTAKPTSRNTPVNPGFRSSSTRPGGIYSENLVDPGRSSIKRRGDSFVIRWPGNPKSALPVLDAEHDYGLYVRHAFEATGAEVARLNGAAMYTGVYMTGEEISAQVSEAIGKKITIESVSFEQYEKDFTAKGMPPHVGLDMRDAAQAVEEFGYYGGKDVFNTEAFTQRKPLSFIEFAKAADWSQITG
ncbi:hypothetical protein R3P38DRAFT_3211739 [Favolaschia claudopus]|uniref:NmrA-like domain-containing protein n=1 Tax=Favolaschia claudopus TaxID=2862362 RepID=A0AAW0AFK0_9AGAR